MRGSLLILKKEGPSAARAGILIQMSKFLHTLVRACKHRPELIKFKNAVSPACSFGNIKSRSLGFNAYGQGYQKENRT